MPEQEPSSNYYELLGISSSASPQQIRRAYRDMSKLYHPDTTELPAAIATNKFHTLNEAYATLSNPEKRFSYDLKNGFSRVPVVQSVADANRTGKDTWKHRSSAYLDPTDRPLSAGEIFALFILGLTFAACLILVVTIGLTRGEVALAPVKPLIEGIPVLEQLGIPALEQPEAPGIEQSETPTPEQPSHPPTVETTTPNLPQPFFYQPPILPLPDPQPEPVLPESVSSAKATNSSLEIAPDTPLNHDRPLQSSIETSSEAPILNPSQNSI